MKTNYLWSYNSRPKWTKYTVSILGESTNLQITDEEDF